MNPQAVTKRLNYFCGKNQPIDTVMHAYYYVFAEMYQMRTNIVLDEEILKEAFRLSDVKTKKELVNLALKEFVDNRKKLNLIELKGRIQFRNSYDYKGMREGK